MKEDEPRTLPDGAVERIVSAVYRASVDLAEKRPINCHACRESLREAINDASYDYFAEARTQQIHQFDLPKRLANLSRIAADLQSVLEDDTEVRDALYTEWQILDFDVSVEDASGGVWGKSAERPIPSLSEVIAFCQFAAAQNKRYSLIQKSKWTVSPLYRLVGLRLSSVFRDHFQQEPGVSRREKTPRERNNYQPKGPFIHFASEALKELKILKNGKPYSLRTIEDAWGDAKPKNTEKISGKYKIPYS